MHLTKEDIRATEKIRQLNLINAVSGIKSANLIGTKSKAGHSNLAIFSSIIHLSSNPATIGFMMRPTGEVPGTLSRIFSKLVFIPSIMCMNLLLKKPIIPPPSLTGKNRNLSNAN